MDYRDPDCPIFDPTYRTILVGTKKKKHTFRIVEKAHK